MRILFRYALLLLSLTAAGTALADQSTPLLYTRTTILIVRQNPPMEAPLPWQKEPKPENPALPIDAEVRDAMTLYNQQGWFNLSSPSENTGVLLAFSTPGIAPITHSAQYAPLDILMIDQEGKIIQIAPSITLSELKQDILPASPVLAFLFLKGGTCAKRAIAPGDTVEYALFKKPPTVLGLPAQPQKAAAPAQPSPLVLTPAGQ